MLRDGTNTQGGITNSLNKVSLPGRPGFSPAPYTFTEQLVVFNIRCTRKGLEPLLVLCDNAQWLSRTDDPTKQAKVQLVSAIPSSDAPFDSMFDVTVSLVIPSGSWEDTDYLTTFMDGSQKIGVASSRQTILTAPGLSAPIFDLQIFLRGPFRQMTLTDAGGSWLKTTREWPGNINNGLLYNGSTNQSYLSNNSSPWLPVSDAGAYVDVSANGGFRITPSIITPSGQTSMLSPSSTSGVLTLETLIQTNVEFRIRAKRRYRMN